MADITHSLLISGRCAPKCGHRWVQLVERYTRCSGHQLVKMCMRNGEHNEGVYEVVIMNTSLEKILTKGQT